MSRIALSQTQRRKGTYGKKSPFSGLCLQCPGKDDLFVRTIVIRSPGSCHFALCECEDVSCPVPLTRVRRYSVATISVNLRAADATRRLRASVSPALWKHAPEAPSAQLFSTRFLKKIPELYVNHLPSSFGWRERIQYESESER